MKKPKKFDPVSLVPFRQLSSLIVQTEAAIERLRERGDGKALAELIFQQRHNLKVMFRQLERTKRCD
jgi:hypothetical protein